MGKLSGKTTIITGATSGIGLNTAKLFLEEGANVVLTGRSQQKLDNLKDQLNGNFHLVHAEASSLRDSKKLMEETETKFGKIDVLFVNAGIFAMHPVIGFPEELYDDVFNINTKGAFFTAQAAIPHLSEGANIIFNTSIASVKGTAGAMAYAASKAALRSIVRTMAGELGPMGIRVNALAPGPIETPIWDKTGMTEDQITEYAARTSKKIPLKRFGKAHEVAKSALFLATADASYISGIELVVDGGMTQI